MTKRIRNRGKGEARKEKGNKEEWEVGWAINRNIEAQKTGEAEGIRVANNRFNRWVRGGFLKTTTRGTESPQGSSLPPLADTPQA